MRPAPTIDDDARQLIASCGLTSAQKIALRGWLLVVPPEVMAQMLGMEERQLHRLQQEALQKVNSKGF
jgi:hypothetical protein